MGAHDERRARLRTRVVSRRIRHLRHRQRPRLLSLLFSNLDFPVDADFAAAYALSKSIRAPRLAFDAVVAAKMAAAYPPLAAVRMRPILDAGVHAASRVKRAILRIFRVDDRPSAATEPEIAPAKPSAAGERRRRRDI